MAGYAKTIPEYQREIADLQAQLQQVQEELRAAEETVGRYNDQWKAVVRGLEEQRDEAIKRGVEVYEYALYLISLTRLAEASRWLIGTRLRTERERAEAAEALAEIRLQRGLAALDILRAVLEAGRTTVAIGGLEWKGWGTARVLTPAEAPAQRGEGDA